MISFRFNANVNHFFRTAAYNNRSFILSSLRVYTLLFILYTFYVDCIVVKTCYFWTVFEFWIQKYMKLNWRKDLGVDNCIVICFSVKIVLIFNYTSATCLVPFRVVFEFENFTLKHVALYPDMFAITVSVKHRVLRGYLYYFIDYTSSGFFRPCFHCPYNIF